jgi:soluble P-type ATPase
MKGVDIVDIEVDIYIDNVDRTGEGTNVKRAERVGISAQYLLQTTQRNATQRSAAQRNAMQQQQR